MRRETWKSGKKESEKGTQSGDAMQKIIVDIQPTLCLILSL